MACGSIQTFFTTHKTTSASFHWSTARTRRARNDSVAICGALVVEGDTKTTGTTMVVEVPNLETNPITLNRSLIKRPLRLETHHEEREVIGNGKFGKFGGKFVPETLVTCLTDLEAEFRSVLHDSEFQVRFFRRKLRSRFCPVFFFVVVL